MKVNIKIRLLLLALSVVLGGCVLPTTLPKDISCPVKKQNCKPKMWSGIPMDTTKSYRDVADYYFIFEPLKKVNSPEDEWSLSFISKKKAILTFTDADQNRVMIARLPRENRVTLESGVGIPLEGSVGAFSVVNDKVAFAAATNQTFLGNSNIYTADIDGNLLTNVSPLSDKLQDDPKTWVSQPALSPNGDVIFFSSDRSHGTGEVDLWFVVKKPDGTWSDPINCGDKINSECDELTPFVTSNGKELLFSSCGHETVGGYDIFRSSISSRFWDDVKAGNIDNLKSKKDYFGTAENLRPPLNTPADELFPTSPGNVEDVLYYSSNQSQSKTSILSKKGGFDLFIRKRVSKVIERPDTVAMLGDNFNFDYEFNDNSDIQPVNIYFHKFKFSGTIYNGTTRQPARNAEITIREIKRVPPRRSFAYIILNDTTGKYKSTVLEKDREFEITAQTQDLSYEKFKLKVDDNNDTVIVVQADDKGKYSVELEKDREFEITAQAKDLFFESFRLRVEPEDTVVNYQKKFYVPEKLTLRVNFPSGNYDEPYKFVLDSNGVETYRTWQEEMNLLANNILKSKGSYKKILLVGHTDDVGSAKNNEELGLYRVDFVISELEKRGVPADMLEGKSAGESDPLDRRKGESKELYRKRLRRVELQKIL